MDWCFSQIARNAYFDCFDLLSKNQNCFYLLCSLKEVFSINGPFWRYSINRSSQVLLDCCFKEALQKNLELYLRIWGFFTCVFFEKLIFSQTSDQKSFTLLPCKRLLTDIFAAYLWCSFFKKKITCIKFVLGFQALKLFSPVLYVKDFYFHWKPVVVGLSFTNSAVGTLEFAPSCLLVLFSNLYVEKPRHSFENLKKTWIHFKKVAFDELLTPFPLFYHRYFL